MALPLDAQSYGLLEGAGTQSVKSVVLFFNCLLLGLHQMPMEWFAEVQQVLWPAEQIEESCLCLSLVETTKTKDPH